MEQTLKKTRLVGFLNQKGGIGKTSTAINLATAIWYDKDLNWDVILWDCDVPQYSSANLRKKDIIDLEYVMEITDKGKMKGMIKQLKKYEDIITFRGNSPSYPIRAINNNEYFEDSDRTSNYLADRIKQDLGKYDIILIDLPGNLSTPETITLLPYMDYIMVPIDYDPLSLDSSKLTLKFLEQYNLDKKRSAPAVDKENVYIYFSKWKKTSSLRNKEYAENDAKKDFSFVKSFSHVINEAENIKSTNLKSLLVLPDGVFNNAHFEEFYNEFIDKIL